MPDDQWPGDEVEVHGEVWRMQGYRDGSPVWTYVGRVYTHNSRKTG
jgi:hypothetical protein